MNTHTLMLNKRDLIGEYSNGNYKVQLYNNGTKIRMTEEEEFIPEFPENCDVKITDKCDMQCKFCYEGCTVDGKHAELFDDFGNPVQRWLEELHPFTELALNGNDLSHPDLDPENPRLLRYLKEKKVVANLTVNQVHFLKHYDTLLNWEKERLIHGLGISLVDSSTPSLIEKVTAFPNAVIHVIVGIVSDRDIKLLSSQKLKLLILGYKSLGRGKTFRENHKEILLDRAVWLQDNLKSIIPMFAAVAFDNLALEQLQVKNLFDTDDSFGNWEELFMGEDGTVTFYIDAVSQQYGINSCVPKSDRKSSKGMTVDEMFNNITQQYE